VPAVSGSSYTSELHKSTLRSGSHADHSHMLQSIPLISHAQGSPLSTQHLVLGSRPAQKRTHRRLDANAVNGSSQAQLAPRLSQRSQPRTCLVHDLLWRPVPYEQVGAAARRALLQACQPRCVLLQAWRWQHEEVERVLAGSAQYSSQGPAAGTAATSTDGLFLLQHPPVYTLGAGSSPEHLLFDPQASGIPLHRTERGGEVTYHGPGQVRSRLNRLRA
jgi:hypothetical protein